MKINKFSQTIEQYISHSYWKQICCLKLHTFLHKQHFYKQRQAEIDKRLSKSYIYIQENCVLIHVII